MLRRPNIDPRTAIDADARRTTRERTRHYRREVVLAQAEIALTRAAEIARRADATATAAATAARHAHADALDDATGQGRR